MAVVSLLMAQWTKKQTSPVDWARVALFACEPGLRLEGMGPLVYVWIISPF